MKECDLVLKGGTTSGVVYPPIVCRIGKDYRLRSVGGTSAGAIAATVAAAAEYRRQMSANRNDDTGFDEVAKLSDELGEDLTRYLQPSAELAPLFEAFVDYQKAMQKEPRPSWIKRLRIIWPKLKAYRKKPIRNGAIIAGASVLAGVAGAGFGLGAAGVGVGVVWAVLQFIITLIKTIAAQLKTNDYGVVPGTTQSHAGDGRTPAISDWLADRIDQIAGNWPGSPPKKPLTVGDLEIGQGGNKPDIKLAAMTTDLTSRRPYSLPLKMPEQYFFNPDEFKKLLPKRVVDYMVGLNEDKLVSGPSGKALYPMPIGGEFPVVLMARMSLSFPILLQAVPLYRRDIALRDEAPWVRCLFSDGGIASNLPVHFFDALLPRRPTFAISLGCFDKERHTEADRVRFDQGVRDRLKLETKPPKGLLGFVFSIFSTAKDWQDKLQSEVPGMYERVVTVRLEPHQGGTNIAMPKPVIDDLKKYGEDAANKLLTEFNFHENRWRRALCLLPELEKAFPILHDAVTASPAGQKNWTYEDLARQYNSQGYPNPAPWPTDVLLPALQEFAALGASIKAKSDSQKVLGGNTPEHDANIRLVASTDLSPLSGPNSGAGV